MYLWIMKHMNKLNCRRQYKEQLKYIYEGMVVEVLIFNNSEVLGINLPDNVTLTVTDTVPVLKVIQKLMLLKTQYLKQDY